MLNHIILMGRLVADPELRYTQSQIPVARFRIACDRDYGGRDGAERQTDFIDVEAWRQTGEFVSKYFNKGSMAVVSGRLQIQEWTDRDNNKRRSAVVSADRVYFGESKRSREENGAYTGPGGYNAGGSYSSGSGGSGYGGSGGGYNAAPTGGGYGAGGGNAYPPAGGAPAGGNNSYRSFDETSGASAFTDLSDSDGDLPF